MKFYFLKFHVITIFESLSLEESLCKKILGNADKGFEYILYLQKI